MLPGPVAQPGAGLLNYYLIITTLSLNRPFSLGSRSHDACFLTLGTLSQIAVLTSEYETRLATTVERYESKISSVKEEHKCALVNTVSDSDTKYAMCVEKYETKLNITIAEHESKRRELSSALSEAQAIRSEREVTSLLPFVVVLEP